MQFRISLYMKEFVLFATTLVVGIFSAYQYSTYPILEALPEIKFSWSDVVFFVLMALFIFLTSKYKKLGKVSYRIFLILVVFSGTQIVAGSFLSQPNDLWATLFIILVFALIKNVFTHNIGVILGVAGIGSILGLSILPKTVVIIMIVLSFYDIIAVYVTKHMVSMAKNMMEAGAIFGFIIPSEIKGLFSNKQEAQAQMGDKFMILGSGDVGLPVVLVSSMVRYSVAGAITVAIFSLLGLLATHLIFVNQKERKPMAALPPIAAMSVLGYLLVLFLL